MRSSARPSTASSAPATTTTTGTSSACVDFFRGWAITVDEMNYTTDEEKARRPARKAQGLPPGAHPHALHQAGGHVRPQADAGARARDSCSRMSTPSGWTTSTPWDDLKKGIYLRSYAQRDPVIEFRMESGEMFNAMVDLIREDTIKMLLTVQVRVTAQPAQPAPQQPAQAPADAAPEKK